MADRKAGIGQFFCSLATVGEAGPLGPRLLSAAGRDSDGQQRQDGSHHALPPEPVAYVHQLIGSKGVRLPRGRVSVHWVSPRSGAIYTILLPNLQLMARAPGPGFTGIAWPVP
jgi:hypothetical protein